MQKVSELEIGVLLPKQEQIEIANESRGIIKTIQTVIVYRAFLSSLFVRDAKSHCHKHSLVVLQWFYSIDKLLTMFFIVYYVQSNGQRFFKLPFIKQNEDLLQHKKLFNHYILWLSLRQKTLKETNI